MENNDKSSRQSISKRKVLRRTVILMAMCGVGFFIPLLARLWTITIVDHDEYQARAARQRAATVQVSASRGEILDANDNVMAVSATVYNLILSPLDLVNSVDEKKFKKDGVTDEGKVYNLVPCEDHVFIEWPGDEPNALGDYWYDIFRFANNDDPVFSTPKERVIVRLKKDANGNWWRTSSTDRYAEFDTQITEDEAQSILTSYKPIALETHPLSEFREP